ncbi:MAG: tetratricopeptide repeat protein [Chitinophagaceae bacterium]|nr:tetratricopeptide repeat protein [Chitinophagaceae bacterium]
MNYLDLRMKTIEKIYLILMFFVSSSVCGQTTQDANRWLLQLKQPLNDSITNTQMIWNEWQTKADSNYIFRADSLLEKEAGPAASAVITIQLQLLKARIAGSLYLPWQGKTADGWALAALQNAAAVDNEPLLFDACYTTGLYFLTTGNSEQSLFYLLKAIELAEKNKMRHKLITGLKIMVSSTLYTTQNYAVTIDFCRDALKDPVNEINTENLIGVYNNIGLAYRATGKYDSALYFFSQAVQAATQKNIGVWVGIASGNMGDVYSQMGKPKLAVPLWRRDIDSCLKYNEPENAGLTMLFLCEYLFKKGDRRQALEYLKKTEALQLKRNHERLIYYRVKAYILKETGNITEAYDYTGKYYRLNDSLNTKITQSNYQKLKLRLDFDNNMQQYKTILQQKQTETIRRNLLLASLALTLLVGWLLLSRLRLHNKLAEQQKIIAETEAQFAKEQLQLFTQTLLQKNEQVEQLNRQLKAMEQKNEEELTGQTILTDEDWNRFKNLFEKANPGFFEKIKSISPDISAAELRLAALIKLNLDNKQMAAMQGISPVSIRSNKTRLRQRLHLTAENGLDDFIRSL